MSIVTATQVRAIGDWSSSDYSDALLSATPYIPIGDAWLNQLCKANGYSAGYTGVTNSYKQGLLTGAECYFVARQIVLIPQKEDFKTGPVESKDVKNTERVKLAESYWNTIRELISHAGFSLKRFAFKFVGGSDYHPANKDTTQIDFNYTSEDNAFNILGGDDAS